MEIAFSCGYDGRGRRKGRAADLQACSFGLTFETQHGLLQPPRTAARQAFSGKYPMPVERPVTNLAIKQIILHGKTL